MVPAPTTGTGNHRQFTFLNLIQARFAAALNRMGVPVEHMTSFVRYLNDLERRQLPSTELRWLRKTLRKDHAAQWEADLLSSFERSCRDWDAVRHPTTRSNVGMCWAVYTDFPEDRWREAGELGEHWADVLGGGVYHPKYLFTVYKDHPQFNVEQLGETSVVVDLLALLRKLEAATGDTLPPRNPR